MFLLCLDSASIPSNVLAERFWIKIQKTYRQLDRKGREPDIIHLAISSKLPSNKESRAI